MPRGWKSPWEEAGRISEEFRRRGLSDRQKFDLLELALDSIRERIRSDEDLADFMMEMMGPEESIRVIREVASGPFGRRF